MQNKIKKTLSENCIQQYTDKDGDEMMIFTVKTLEELLSQPSVKGTVSDAVLKEIQDVCGSVNFSSHSQMKEAINGVMEITERELLSLTSSKKEEG